MSVLAGVPDPPCTIPGHHLQPSLCVCKPRKGMKGCLSAMFSFHLNSDLLSDVSTFLWKWQLVDTEYLRYFVQIWPGKSRGRQSPDCSGLTLLLQDDVNSAIYRNKSSVSWGFLMFKTRWYFLPWLASELWFPWQPQSSTYCNFPVLWVSSSSITVSRSLGE